MTQQVTMPDGTVHMFPDEATPDMMESALAPQPPAAPQTTNDNPDIPLWYKVAREGGLAGRAMIEGPASVLSGVADLANTGVNDATTAINNNFNTNIPQLGMVSNDVPNLLTKMGYPLPEDNTQNNVQKISTLATALMPQAPALADQASAVYNNGKDMLADALAAPKTPTTAAQAKQIASQLYAQADAQGGQLTPQFTDDLIAQAQKIAPQTDAGRLTAGDSTLSGLIDKWQNGIPSKGISPLSGQPLSLQAVQEMDQGLGGLIDKEYGVKGLSQDGKNLLDLQTNFRNMISDAGPEHIVGGNEGFDSLDQARQAWAQAAKMGDLERIQARAAQSDNPATTIKSGVRTLLSNPARVRGYSDDELAALNNAGDRGVLGGALHVFGSRLLPIGAGLVGESMGGPAGMVISGAVAHGGSAMARNLANALQGNKLQGAINTIGSNVPGQLP